MRLIVSLIGFFSSIQTSKKVYALTQLSRLRQISELRNSLQNWTRLNNVDVHESMNGTSFCHIADLFFHSFVSSSGERFAKQGLSQEAVAAVALALQHLNAGDGTVVSDLDGLDQRCNVRFTVESLDTSFSPSRGVDHVIEATERKEGKPCAFLGAGLSTVSIASATVAGLKGYPQLSWLSISSKLSDSDQFPLFARMSSPMEAAAVARLEYIYTLLGARHWALVYSDDPSVLEEMRAVQEIARERYPDLNVEPIPYVGKMTESTAKTVLGALVDSKLIYAHAAIYGGDLEQLMHEAHRQGVDGKYVWTFRDTRIASGRVLKEEYTPDDPLLTSLPGSLRLEPLLGAPGIARYDAFAKAWQAIGASEDDTTYLHSTLPKYPDEPTYQPVLDSSCFETPGPYIAQAYDAAVLLGLAACGAPTQFFNGQEMFDSMLNITFVGASGVVDIDPETRARRSNAVNYRLLNWVTETLSNGNFTIVEVEVGLFNGTNWEKTSDIVFNGGATTPPPDLPPLDENRHLIDVKLRGFGFFLSGFVVISSVAMSLWTWVFAKRARVVQASQPFFLHLICAGTLLEGLAIVPLSLDDGFVSDKAADTACVAFPWLFALGWAISFSALFSKTMRVNMLFHNPSFRRVTVSISDVMKPMTILLVCNVALLLLWTIVSPLKFERQLLARDEFGRQSESLGFCRSDRFWWFFIPIAFMNFAALIVANHQAYVARKLSTEFAESDHISRAMSLILIVALLVVPLEMISDSTPNLSFFIAAMFVGTVALSLLFFIFIPKIMYRSDPRSVKDAIRTSMLQSSSKLSDSTSTVNSIMRGSPDAVGELVLVHPKLALSEQAQNRQRDRQMGILVGRVSRLRSCVLHLGGTADHVDLDSGDLDLHERKD